MADSVAEMTGGFSGREVVRLMARSSALGVPLEEARAFLDSWHRLPSAAVSVEQPSGDWGTIGACQREREQLDKSIGFAIVHPGVYQSMFAEGGASLLSSANGVLLHGPPGVGKTLCAEAFCAGLWPKISFLRVRTPLLLSKYVGESEETIRHLFKLARQLSPSEIGRAHV